MLFNTKPVYASFDEFLNNRDFKNTPQQLEVIKQINSFCDGGMSNDYN